MPKQYTDKTKVKGKGGKKSPIGGTHASRMTPAQHKRFSKAVKDGHLTKKQHDGLSAPLLEAILKKKKK